MKGTIHFSGWCLCYLYFEYKKQATNDYRTGLKNARQFDLHLSKVLSNTNLKPNTAGLLFIDIDHFKQINDSYGHPAGDFILQEIAVILKKSVRRQDKVFRYGGEEFSALLIDTNLQKAIEIGERIRTSVEANAFILQDNTRLNVTISVGVATNSGKEETPLDLVNAADEALYKVKNSGRNIVCWT